jgi:hypothetical protein
VTDKGVPDVRMNDKSAAETPTAYTGSKQFITLFFTPPHWKGHSHFKFINAKRNPGSTEFLKHRH